MSQARELSLRQQLFIGFLACFFAGILMANFLGADIFQENGSLTRYYLKQLQYAEIEPRQLLWHVCGNRLPLFFALLLLGSIPRGKLVHAVFVAWSGFAYGYFCVMTICGYGARGLILCVAALFPQFLFYVPVYLGLVELTDGRDRNRKGFRYLLAVLLLFSGLLAGILLESYANPMILQKMLIFL